LKGLDASLSKPPTPAPQTFSKVPVKQEISFGTTHTKDDFAKNRSVTGENTTRTPTPPSLPLTTRAEIISNPPDFTANHTTTPHFCADCGTLGNYLGVSTSKKFKKYLCYNCCVKYDKLLNKVSEKVAEEQVTNIDNASNTNPLVID